MIKLTLIAVGLLATTGPVYAACMFCWSADHGKSPVSRPGFFFAQMAGMLAAVVLSRWLW